MGRPAKKRTDKDPFELANRIVNRFFVEATGSTAIEYGLIACLVGLAAVSVFSALGSGIVDNFTMFSEHIQTK